jgi:uncharacterized protein
MPIITKPLIEMITGQSSLSKDGYHGLDHWVRVLANGRTLSRETGANLKVVELFAVFHDARRKSEGYDLGHGLRGAKYAEEMRGEWFDLSDDEMGLLTHACEYHSGGMTDADITVQTCWDADRLDLGRVGTMPSPQYLCTDAAKKSEMIELSYRRSIKKKNKSRNGIEFMDRTKVSRFNLGELLQQDTADKDDPNEIAAYLVQENGLGRAIEISTSGVGNASAAGDNYSLSIWREVRVVLRKHV